MNKNLVLYGVFLHTFFPSVINHVKLQIAGWVDENKCILIVYSNAVQLRIRKKSYSLLLLFNLWAERNKYQVHFFNGLSSIKEK